MNADPSRRALLRGLLLFSAAGALAGAAAAAPPGSGAAAKAAAGGKPNKGAAPLPHLTADDDMAQALSYHENARAVDARRFPAFKPGQSCATCSQLGGREGESWRPCGVLPGGLVNASGWCTAYARKA